MKKKYCATKGSRITNQVAYEIGKRIEQIKPNGYITPEELLNDAVNIKSPIHKYFEWNNKKAADEYRLWQARHYLKSIQIIVLSDGKEVTTRAYHNIKVGDERSYIATHIVCSDKSLYQQLLDMALSEANNWMERYKQYKELNKIFKAIKEMNGKF